MPKIKAKLKVNNPTPTMAQEEIPVKVEEKRKFVLVSNCGDGLGFALQEIRENGSEVILSMKPKEELKDGDEQEAYDLIGSGLLERIDLDELMKVREDYRDYYWIWDSNHNPDENELLREEGFKVFGGSQLMYDCENDREFGVELSESVGLHSPETQEFSNYKEGIKFLEQNEEKAYVFKPNGNEDSAMTTVPVHINPIKANLEIRQCLESFKINDFILQERLKATEICVEVWVQNGEMKCALANLEFKRRSNEGLGKMTGCAGDLVWEVGLETQLVQKTVGLFKDYFKEQNYTGFWDSNILFSDDGVYFLEFCQRFGYNQSPNFFSTISFKTALQTCADLVDGVFEPRFRKGFGASIALRTDCPKAGIPIEVPENLEKNFFHFFNYKEDDIFKMSGYGDEIGIVTAHNYTIDSAFQDCLANAKQIIFTNRDYRTDFREKGFHDSIVDRYDAIVAMKLLD